MEHKQVQKTCRQCLEERVSPRKRTRVGWKYTMEEWMSIMYGVYVHRMISQSTGSMTLERIYKYILYIYIYIYIHIHAHKCCMYTATAIIDKK